MSEESTSVRVALRVRPITAKEKLEHCSDCITYVPGTTQMVLGSDKAFTFDYIFDDNIHQEEVYKNCVASLMDQFLMGFNATVFAYGQTGSGKTYSMGTSMDQSKDPNQQGIVPRAINHLFEEIAIRKSKSKYYQSEVSVSFLELYNEDLLDLLNPQPRNNNSKNKDNLGPQIREDPQGGIYWTGVKEIPASNPDELMNYMYQGLICRSTASTDMNLVSSRSHAIFSVTLKQQLEASWLENGVIEESSSDDPDAPPPALQNIVSKFHFVDLAGSERLKKTNAVGGRAKEGISINAGLLALGNVISALGDAALKGSHVPYRNSKLTRLLQDSLGGNSKTLMLACISPSDTNFLETLSTLKYANRARNIKNRVQVNVGEGDPKEEIQRLRAELARVKLQLVNMNPPKAPTPDSHQVSYQLKQKDQLIKQLQSKIRAMSSNELDASSSNGSGIDMVSQLEQSEVKCSDLKAKLDQGLEIINDSVFKLNRIKDHLKALDIDPSHPEAQSLENDVDTLSTSLLNTVELFNNTLNTHQEPLSPDDTDASSPSISIAPVDPIKLSKTISDPVSQTKNPRSIAWSALPASMTSPTSKTSGKEPSQSKQIRDLTLALKKALAERDAAVKRAENASQTLRTKASSPALNGSTPRKLSVTPPNVPPAGMAKLKKELEMAQRQIQQQKQEIMGLKKENTRQLRTPSRNASRPVSRNKNLSEFPDYNSQQSPNGLRASFKKRQVEDEINYFLMGRKTRITLHELITKLEPQMEELEELLSERDRLQTLVDQHRETRLNNMNDGMESFMQVETEVELESLVEQLRFVDDQLELLEAEVSYTEAKIRALERKAETTLRSESGSQTDDLYGENHYKYALKLLSELDDTETQGMLELLLKDVVTLQMDTWTYEMTIKGLDQQNKELQNTLGVLKQAAATMAMDYENRILALETGVDVAELTQLAQEEYIPTPEELNNGIGGMNENNMNNEVNLEDFVDNFQSFHLSKNELIVENEQF